MKTLIPIVLLTLLIAAPTNAEDLFEIKLGTPLKKIKKRYPDLKPDKDEFGLELYQMSARTRNSIFHRIRFNFDDNDKLKSFSGAIYPADQTETEKGCDKARALLLRRCGNFNYLPGDTSSDSVYWIEDKIFYGLNCFGKSLSPPLIEVVVRSAEVE
jgi:hypothetical protein